MLICVMNCTSVIAMANPYPGNMDSNCTYAAWQKAKDILGIELPSWGNAWQWYSNAQTAGYSVGSTPRANSIVVFKQASWNSNYGHVAFVTDYNSATNQIYKLEGNYNGKFHEGWAPAYESDMYGYIYLSGNPTPPVEQGTEMSSGYPRTIPDGDYLIANSGSPDKSAFYYIDIEGTAVPAAAGTNVSLCGPLSGDPPVCDIWTLTYSGGFYYIKQKGTNMSLDVWNIDKSARANIGVSAFNGGKNQQWAISPNASGLGYRIQARHSGYSIDFTDGIVSGGTNIVQYKNNNSYAQSWIFIPYKPAQPLADGRYVIVNPYTMFPDSDNGTNRYGQLTADYTEATANSILTGNKPVKYAEFSNNANVYLKNGKYVVSEYFTFKITKLDNGYYTIIHDYKKFNLNPSTLSLDVTDGLSKVNSNIALHTANGSPAQQFAIIPTGSDYYIIPKCSGYALEIESRNDGANIRQNPLTGAAHQCWKFIIAEHKVTFNANGGTSAPSAQTKYYKDDLTITSSVPVKENYTFKGWNTKADGTGVSYASGSKYTADADITLYAKWELNHTHKASAWQTVTEPTCTEKGVRQKVCTICGAVMETGNISAKGHSWDAGKITRQPTVTAKGVRTYTCTVCGKTKTEAIPSLTESYKGFPDVKEGSWYYDAVKYVALRGYMSGYQNGNFGPNDNLKRQDFVVILANIAKADLSKYQNTTSKLKDVKKGAYYAAAVNWAVDKNIIAGYDNGNFGVGDNITREQIAVILYRYKNEPAVGSITATLSKFSDYKNTSAFAVPAMAWAVQQGAISGNDDGTLAPTKTASRAQIASIIMRMDQKGIFK